MTDHRIRPSGHPGRRGVLLGLAATAATPAWANSPPVLSGTDFALEVGTLPVNITGRSRIATVVNGQMPAPILRWKEGDAVTLRVTNRLDQDTSIHWHGIRTPYRMDGVPGLSFPGIRPGETFTYRFEVPQHGTYWYHAHSGFQEQTGLYGAIVVDPRAGYRQGFDRDYVVLLSDWSDESPARIFSKLKFQADVYNNNQRTVADFVADVGRVGLGATLADRRDWGEMRMAPTDILDVTSATYTYLMNGHTAASNWTALFRPGERVRLRFINAGAMTMFDIRIPGLAMTVVQADGNDVEPVEIDEFRIGAAETYDVIVSPREDRAYPIFAQAQNRTGFAAGTLAPRAGMSAPIPPLDPPPLRTMGDMGMDHGSHAHGHGAMSDGPALGVSVDNVAAMVTARVQEPGAGLGLEGRRALTYADLRSPFPAPDQRPPSRDIVLRLTGNMHRFIWGFDGRKYAEAEPIHLRLNERVRFVLINDTMMDHPIHLHGLWSEVENGQGERRPIKHTVLVKPAERLTFLVTADLPGRWAFHCHLLYHMEAGMFREVRVS